MIKCSKCNSMPSDNDVIGWKCNSCGKAFQVKKAQLQSILVKKKANPEQCLCKCPSCGNGLDDGNESIAWKCSCGHVNMGKLHDFEEKVEVEEKESKKEVVPDVPKSHLIACPECGKEISSDVKFCPNCGHSFGQDIRERKLKNVKTVLHGKLQLKYIISIAVVVLVIVGGLVYHEIYIKPVKNEIKKVETMINNIGEVTIESGAQIEEAQKYYDALTEKQKEKVDNHFELLEKKAEYEKVLQEEKERKAQNEANLVIESIEQLATIEYPKQADIDAVQESYANLSDMAKKYVTNVKKIDSINQLNDIEKKALLAAQSVRDTLKNEDSFQLKEIVVKKGDSSSVFAYAVKVSYTGTNSFGGTLEECDYVDITSTGKLGLWGLGLLTVGHEKSTQNVFLEYIKSDSKEIEIDAQRIMNHINDGSK